MLAVAHGAHEALRTAAGGQVTLATVSSSIVGGSCCILAVAAGGGYTAAVEKSPLFLAWGLLIAAQGVVAWAGLLPILWTWRRLWATADDRTHRHLGAALGAVFVCIIAFFLALFLFVPPLHVDWPLGSHHRWRILIVALVVLFPALLAILTMWLAAAGADRPPPEGARMPSEVVQQYLEHRETVQACLWFLGVVVGAVVLATGMLRQSMLAGNFATEETYSATLVLDYGAFFTLIVLLCYAPAYGLIRRAGNRLQHEFLPNTTDVLSWEEQRSKLTKALGLELRLDQSLKDAVAILSPLLASLVSTALPALGR